ncbi:MAG: FkbM family methyltransferase [Candidatus Marsarchaeota archaeon]|nr:FkbM family methyltransferase [Candidatus Marsarchaeota archaeon]
MLTIITKNWYDILLFKLGQKSEILIETTLNSKAKIKNFKEYAEFWNGYQAAESKAVFYNKKYNLDIKIRKHFILFKKFNNSIKLFHGGRPNSILSLITENFILEQYSKLEIKNNIIVDIGANVGDSTIFFVLNGAKKVYALEPYPHSYNLARKNVMTNKLNKKIILLNAAIGKNTGFYKLDETFKSFDSSSIKNFNKGKNIRVYSLSDLIKKFNLTNVILKMDCEGFEYESILTTENSMLRKFSQIFLEYHYYYEDLVKKLRSAGFKVTVTMPIYLYNKNATDPNMYIGKIIAIRMN